MRRSVVVLLTIAGLVLAGCGPAIMPGAAPETEGGQKFVIALPRIVLTFDDNGVPGVEGMDVQAIAKSLGYPLDLSAYRMDPNLVKRMTWANIQHIELRQTGEGIALLVNGKLMPRLTYKNGSLEATAGLVRMLGPQNEQLANLLQKLAPVIKRLGLSIVLKFPLQESAQPIALAADDVVLAEPEPAAGPASAIVQFEIVYDEQGVPSIMGISARDLAALNMNLPLALHWYYLQQAQANNIQYLQLRSKGDGLYLFVNGVPLPALAWDKATLENMLNAAQQAYADQPIAWDIVKQIVPLLGNTDVSILVHLPVAPGVTPIPITMQ